MGSELTESKKPEKHPLPALFESLGIKHIKPSDQFSLNYRDGILEARVKRRSGQTETVSKYAKGEGFAEMSAFDPTQMEKSERNQLIKSKYAKGETQQSLANKFGLTQAMICRIVNS